MDFNTAVRLGDPGPAVRGHAAVTIPSLDEWEELVASKIVDIDRIPKVA